MKAQIESAIQHESIAPRLFFVDILNIIANSDNECELRTKMSNFTKSSGVLSFFDYGFGSSHMYVHERGVCKRLIFVEF